MDNALLRRAVSKIVTRAADGLNFHANRLNQIGLEFDPMTECLSSLEILAEAQKAISIRMAEAFRDVKGELDGSTEEGKAWVDSEFSQLRRIG